MNDNNNEKKENNNIIKLLLTEFAFMAAIAAICSVFALILLGGYLNGLEAIEKMILIILIAINTWAMIGIYYYIFLDEVE